MKLTKEEIEDLIKIVDDDFLTEDERFENKFNEIIQENTYTRFQTKDYRQLYDLSRKLLCVYPNTLENKDKTKTYYFIEVLENRTLQKQSVLLLDEDYKPFIIDKNHFIIEFFNNNKENAENFIKEKTPLKDTELEIVETSIGQAYKDKNGNMWSVKYNTYDEALMYSKSLENCKYCFECRDCKDCENCIHCKNCVDCSNCSLCFDMIDCVDCFKCGDCEACYSCIDCYECNNCECCEYCNGCENCNLCMKCDFVTCSNNCECCIDCHSCKNLKDESGLDNVIKDTKTNINTKEVHLTDKEYELYFKKPL